MSANILKRRVLHKN